MSSSFQRTTNNGKISRLATDKSYRYSLIMDSKEFRKRFGEMAKSYGFKSAFGGCYKESSECIFVLQLQKSNFGDYYELNIKTYIQGTFGKKYVPDKDTIKKYMGNVFDRQPKEYCSLFDFDIAMSDEDRMQTLKKFFDDFVIPYEEKALSVSGVRELADEGRIFLLSTVKDELDRLYPVN